MINFIKEYQIDPELCQQLVTEFELIDDKFKGVGEVGNLAGGTKVDKDQKDSLDFCFSDNIQNPHPKMWALGQAYLKQIQRKFMSYKADFTILEGKRFGMMSPFQIQRYLPGGGFKTFHFENGASQSRSRVLAFMTYLNDVETGGTEFLYQGYTAESKIGNTLIWPADFTHTHRGVIANETKYIITGWIDIVA